MEIEIVTTKKKLSKSIINQMLLSMSADTIKYAVDNNTVIGTIYNARKPYSAVALVKDSDADYKLVPLIPLVQYEGNPASEIKPSVVYKNRSYRKEFETVADMHQFMLYYEQLITKAKETHIYV